MPYIKVCNDKPLKKNEIRDTLANCYRRGYNDAIKIHLGTVNPPKKLTSKEVNIELSTPKPVNIEVVPSLVKKPKKTASSSFTYKRTKTQAVKNPYEETDIKTLPILKVPKQTASSNFIYKRTKKDLTNPYEQPDLPILEQQQMMMNDTDIRGPINRRELDRIVEQDTNIQPQDIVYRDVIQPEIPQSNSIKEIVSRALASRGSKTQIDVLISNSYFNVPELSRRQKKELKTAGMIKYLKENKGYVD